MIRLLGFLSRGFLSLGALTLSLLSPQANALVVLQYHHIDDNTPAITSTRPAVFKQHLAMLKEEDMQVIDLNQALATLNQGKELPIKTVVITFDDAYLSIYENAWPELKKAGFPFTVFVNPKQADANLANMMNWQQLKELQDNGVIIANHSQTHPYLIEQSGDLNSYLNDEINAAENRLKEQLGTSHKLFAYPYGEFNLAIAQWLKEQGYTAFGQQSGAVGVHTFRQALPRYPAGGVYANPDTLKTKLYTLAFALDESQYLEPVLGKENPPKLTLSLKVEDFYPNQVQCYSGSEGELEVIKKVKEGVLTLSTQAKAPITSGRDRYNCTAPSIQHKGFYYWYSQQWINPSVPNR